MPDSLGTPVNLHYKCVAILLFCILISPAQFTSINMSPIQCHSVRFTVKKKKNE